MHSSPDVSVVVPVYNDPEGVATTLDSLLNQTHGAYEVVVVDNDSDDETPAVIEDYADRYPDLVSHERETDVQTSYAARNAGIEATSSPVLAFLDADVTVGDSWLKTIHDRLDEMGVDYLGCEVVNGPADPRTAVEKFNRHSEHTAEHYLREYDFVPTCCLVVRRRVFEVVGQFDPTLVSSGDREFGSRVAAAGFEQGYTAAATVYHPSRSARELWRKHFRVGRGLTQIRRRYPDRFATGSSGGTETLFPTVSPRELKRSARRVRQSLDVEAGPADLVGFFLLSQLVTFARAAGRTVKRVRPAGHPDWKQPACDLASEEGYADDTTN